MDDLIHLAKLIHMRNQTEREISALIGRPASIGHIGEFIASRIFNIVLEQSASHKSSDGYFADGALQGRTVNIKWYAFQEWLLDITPLSLPDFYLVLTGRKADAMTSPSRIRPWTIGSVYLFNAQELVDNLKRAGVSIGTATTVRRQHWEQAKIYPASRNELLELSPSQREALALFSSGSDG
jgi:hypothetical protein